ncbi:MAG TPA: PIN domain-containing protein [Ramlibacter sp.]|uniref:PIN domain-containing protein n=1 Tax=Ramlibacter sp. TaxID=1917967 RepID=UPI002C714B91|nr:PIN domain-containing protein [Ramlibacter sp.]HVZ44619.1 PIN domain-containing protein [Ramlibacter sp.]
MTGPTVFVDSNILIYSEDPGAQAKQQVAFDWLRLLWQRRIGRLSTQVLNEFYVNVTRKLTPAMPVGDARAKIRQYADWNPWLVDAATVESAWAVEARYGLHFWDSLVVAAAQHSGCRYLISEDMSHEQSFGGVTVLNPFLCSVERLQPA